MDGGIARRRVDEHLSALPKAGRLLVIDDGAAGEHRPVVVRREHSAEIVPEQARHLLDPEKCAMTEHRYGPITRKTVLYRGTIQDVDGIQYVNVEEYLKGVG